jgi:SAM-dependent methyltransferase
VEGGPGEELSTVDQVREFYALLGDAAEPEWAGDTGALHFGLDGDDEGSFEDSLERTTALLAERAGVQPGDRVLDVGCGVGGSTVWLALRGAEVTGVTVVEAQLERARERADALSVMSLSATFALQDYMALDFAPASFDVLWHIESLCLGPDRDAYLSQALPLLRPDGRFACIDLFATGDVQPLEDMRRACAFGPLVSVGEFEKQLRTRGLAVQTEDLSPRVLRSMERVHSSAVQAAARARLQVMFGGSPAVQARAEGAVACAEAVLDGRLCYAFVGGRLRC